MSGNREGLHAGAQPSPLLFFETASAYQRSFVLKAAAELDVFTAIAKGAHTAAEIGKACGASERGIRILCDYLTVVGFLTKAGGQYSLTPDSAFFLDSRSPAYLGKAMKFLTHPWQFSNFEELAETVRKGGRTESEISGFEPDAPIWVDFARGMAPLMLPAAQTIARSLQEFLSTIPAPRVLDIAAGHGMFGITLAQKHGKAEIYALDWPSVLQVAQENARALGVAERHHLLPGSALERDFGKDYDVVLLTNFLHHYSVDTSEMLLRKTFAALKPGGRVAILEFVPNDDRVSPPPAATFSMVMLAHTAEGDAYTFAELESMCRNSGFTGAQMIPVEGSPGTVVVARRQ